MSVKTGRVPFLATADNSSVSIDETSEQYNPELRPSEIIILPGKFPKAPRFEFNSNMAGDMTDVNITFTTSNPWPADGALRIIFPTPFYNLTRCGVVGV